MTFLKYLIEHLLHWDVFYLNRYSSVVAENRFHDLFLIFQAEPTNLFMTTFLVKVCFSHKVICQWFGIVLYMTWLSVRGTVLLGMSASSQQQPKKNNNKYTTCVLALYEKGKIDRERENVMFRPRLWVGGNGLCVYHTRGRRDWGCAVLRERDAWFW